MLAERQRQVLVDGRLQELAFSILGGIDRARKQNRWEGSGLKDEADRKSSTKGPPYRCCRQCRAARRACFTLGRSAMLRQIEQRCP